jgi:hypothetical protein
MDGWMDGWASPFRVFHGALRAVEPQPRAAVWQPFGEAIGRQLNLTLRGSVEGPHISC